MVNDRGSKPKSATVRPEALALSMLTELSCDLSAEDMVLGVDIGVSESDCFIIGMTTLTSVPRPSSLCISMEPPSMLVMLRTIDRPKLHRKGQHISVE